MKTIKVPRNFTLGQIRTLIGAHFKVPFDGFSMKIGKVEYDTDFNIKRLSEISSPIDEIHVIRKEQGSKRYLLQNQRYIDTLFSLMTKNNLAYTEYVWCIVNEVSCYKDIQQKIEALNVEVIFFLKSTRKAGMFY